MNAFTRRSLRSLLVCAPLLSVGLAPALLPGRAAAQTEAPVSCDQAPPVLPVYAQPPMPEAGYVWTPGYWQWVAATGYYWVPGTWVLPPAVNVLWTPPYWGWAGGLYVFHVGYWGPHVGYYGGINYGYGYGGAGYQGGRWRGGHFAYNSAVTNFGSVRVGSTYRQSVLVHSSRVSFNGGAGGVRAEPTARERGFEGEAHQPLTTEQTRHVAAAAAHPGLVAGTNRGRPQIAATSRPAAFEGRGVVAPREARAAPRPATQHAASRPEQHHAAAGRPEQHQQARRAAARPEEHRAAAPREGRQEARR